MTGTARWNTSGSTGDAQLVVLDRGFRVPAQIINYAARLLPEIAPGLRTPTGVRKAPGSLTVSETDLADRLDRVTLACHSALRSEGSVGVIAADADILAFHNRLRSEGTEVALVGETEDALDATRLVCLPASLAKGLEFGTVIAVEPAQIIAAEPRGLHRLYVVLTRAVSALEIVHAEPLPTALADPTG